MEFKEMAREMSDHDVKRCMSILVEGSTVLEIKRDLIGNGIDIQFRIRGDSTQQIYEIGINPSGIEEISEGVHLRINAEYYLTQFFVARGFSEFWENNIFLEEENI